MKYNRSGLFAESDHLSLGRRDLCHPGGRAALGHDLDGLLRVDAVRTAWLTLVARGPIRAGASSQLEGLNYG